MKDYALSSRSRAVTAKKCTKKFDVLAKFFFAPVAFLEAAARVSKYNTYKSEYSRALNASYTLQPLTRSGANSSI